MDDGYWICRKCNHAFYAGGYTLHKKTCPDYLISRSSLIDYKGDFIYVFGPLENGSWCPFKKEDLKYIKSMFGL